MKEGCVNREYNFEMDLLNQIKTKLNKYPKQSHYVANSQHQVKECESYHLKNYYI